MCFISAKFVLMCVCGLLYLKGQFVIQARIERLKGRQQVSTNCGLLGLHIPYYIVGILCFLASCTVSHGACKSQWLQQGFTTRIFVLRRHSSQKKDRDEAAKKLHIIERKYHVELE